jgi:chromate transporter
MSHYLLLGWIFFKIGLFSIGGGYAMLPLINSELVGYGLMTQLEVADIVAVSQMTPGTFAINAATFAGVKTTGLFGGVIATVAVVLPSLIITTILAKYFFKFEDNIIVRRAMWGLRPVVTGLIAAAAAIMALPALLGVTSVHDLHWASLLSGVDIPSIVIALLSGFAIIKFKRSPILIIFIAGVVGLLLFGVLGIK